jgi:hypothetical protein
MTNKEKALEIAKNSEQYFYHNEYECGLACALQMAKWKDEQMKLLLDAIDHAYLQTDGTYGELSYEVSDKVKYLKTHSIV